MICRDDEDESRRDQESLDLVELLEAVTYLVCQDNHVVPDTFYKVRTTTFNSGVLWYFVVFYGILWYFVVFCGILLAKGVTTFRL